jgi:membrane protease YdiL (CAAX protease family)
MGALILLVIVASTIWVGFDASGRDFTTGKRWVMAKGPVGWALGCLVLWIVFFPAYLAQRGRAPVKNSDA